MISEDGELWRNLFIRQWGMLAGPKLLEGIEGEVASGQSTWKKLFAEYRKGKVADTQGGFSNFTALRSKLSDEDSGFFKKMVMGRLWLGKKEFRILMVGLDAAGM